MDVLPAFELRRAGGLAEAARWLESTPGARALAGGTDLLPNLRRGIDSPPLLVDLGHVPGFAELQPDGEALRLGAGLALARLAQAQALRQPRWAALAQAADAVAAPALREAATLGGNLCQDTRCVFYNQSAWWRAANGHCLKRGGSECHVAPQGRHCHAAFCGDVAPALLALGAQAELVSARATRHLPLAELYREDGAAHLALAAGELLAAVHLPAGDARRRSGYAKARVRGAIDFALAGVAIALRMDGGVLAELRVALTGTNSRPFVLEGSGALLGRPVDDAALAALGKLVAQQTSPMRSTLTPAHHRRQRAVVLAQRLLRALASPEPAGPR